MCVGKIQLEDAIEELKQNAGTADSVQAWPEKSWQALRKAGVLRWAVSERYGGAGLEGIELLIGYERIAQACLTTTFILSQRDAACRRLRYGENESLRQELLPALAEGQRFATIGLSQLTTSRQHLGPSLSVELDSDKIRLHGSVPWVTCASNAQYIIVGAALKDGRQVLAVVPQSNPGVIVESPLALMALEGSLTTQIRCENVVLERRWLLAGPAERVMAVVKGGAGGLETTCLALGLAGAAIEYQFQESQRRPELMPIVDRLERSRCHLRSDLHGLVQREYKTEEAANLRTRANSLVLRATQAALTASKGTGFTRDHPAQRWARQALFFLVWSCPRPVADATLASLANEDPFTCP